MVFVDGPPDTLQDNSRYPVMPLLYEKLSPNAIVIMDDGKREQEANIVSAWMKEFQGLKVDYIPSQKGTFIIRINKQNL
jgi:hypothetical protein